MAESDSMTKPKPRPGPGPATMAQIAERSGVALSTVSYVLSGKRPVSDAMRERGAAAVAEVDYPPPGPAPPRARAARPPGPSYSALLLSTAASDPETIVRLAATHRADGVILMETLTHDPRIEKLQAAGFPFCLIGRTTDTSGIGYVDIDYRAAVRTSLEHLVELGHHCVALFNFPQDQLDAGYASALIARDAFEVATAELGIRGLHLTCPHPPQEAFAVAAWLLASEPDCTAAITTGWQFSGLLGALRAANLHVPDEFSVVSVIAAQYAEMLTPALTGIEWPAFEAGRLAAEMLIERLADDSVTHRQLLFGGELVIRESTGPARSVTPPAKPTDARERVALPSARTLTPMQSA